MHNQSPFYLFKKGGKTKQNPSNENNPRESLNSIIRFIYIYIDFFPIAAGVE